MSGFVCGDKKWVSGLTHLPYQFETIPVSKFNPEFQQSVNEVVGKDGCVDSREELQAAVAAIRRLTIAKSNISAGHIDPKKPQVSDRSVTLASSNGDVYDFTVKDTPTHQVVQVRNQKTHTSSEISLRDFRPYGDPLPLGKVVQIASNGQSVFLRFDNVCDLVTEFADRGTGTFTLSVSGDDFCFMGGLSFSTFAVSEDGKELYLFGYEYDGHSSGIAHYYRANPDNHARL